MMCLSKDFNECFIFIDQLFGDVCIFDRFRCWSLGRHVLLRILNGYILTRLPSSVTDIYTLSNDESLFINRKDFT